MTESTLSVSYNDLRAEVAIFLGYSSNLEELSDSQSAEVDRYVQSGVRQFYYPPATEGVEVGYKWSFLSPSTSIDTVADVDEQDLPSDFGRILGSLSFEESEGRHSVVQISEGRMMNLRQRGVPKSAPRAVAVRYKQKEAATGHRMEILWWPTPEKVYTLYYRYEAYTGKLAEDNLYPLGGMRYAELITESCLSVAEQRANDELGLHTQSFMRLLASGVAYDRKQGGKVFGNMGAGDVAVVPRRGDTGRTYPISYKGNTW